MWCEGPAAAAVLTSDTNEPRFSWARDGDVRVELDPFSAGWREGSEPDALLPEMERLGFDLSDDDADYDERATGRALALARHVTGIRLTGDTLTRSTFLAVSVPAGGDPAEVPPLYFHDVEPTVDRPDTLDLGGDGLTAAEIGRPITVRPSAHVGSDA